MVSDIPAGDGNIEKFFYSVGETPCKRERGSEREGKGNPWGRGPGNRWAAKEDNVHG